MGFGSVRHTTIAIETHPHPDLPLEGEGEKTSKTRKKVGRVQPAPPERGAREAYL